jgi:hypothetical protein
MKPGKKRYFFEIVCLHIKAVKENGSCTLPWKRQAREVL